MITVPDGITFFPRGGTGRYTGGLSVFTFLAIRTWMRLDQSNEDGISVVSDAMTS